mgnify:CR=1 FL=1|tara:strand:+ start:1132 stop:2940 length:1809 start_codon:yes stop_codon:yes gene_type:complete
MDNNVIFFSSLEWNTQRQVVHEYCEYLAKKKINVLFIENTGVRSFELKDSRRLGRAIKNFFKLRNLFYKVDDNITIFRPIYVPFFQYSSLMVFLNSFIINFFISIWVKGNNISNFSCVSFLPTPLIQNLIKKLKPKSLIYYCIDNLALKSSNYEIFKKYENNLFKIANLVICTSRILEKNAKKFSNNVIYVPSGVNYKKLNFYEDNLNIAEKLFFENLKGTVFGYVGAIRDIIDYDYIKKIIKETKNSYFVFVGPIITEPPKEIQVMSNVFFIGQKNHNQIPSYISKFDICLIPYQKNDFTDAIYPTKINEYLSLGKPIVSIPIYEVNKFSKENFDIINFLDLGHNIEDQIKKILVKDEHKIKLRKEIAQNNDWNKRFEIIESKLDEKIKKKQIDWDNYISLKTKKYQKYFLRFFLIFAMSIFIFTNESIKLLAAKNLIVDNKDFKSDTIVVFSGYGNSKYHNFEYRQRIKDVEDYLTKNNVENILIYGRNKIINENEIIASFLVKKGYKNNLILINDKLNNTMENVNLVKRELDKIDVKEIVFFSSPLLYKRIEMLWKKKDKQIKIYFYNSNILNNKKDINGFIILYEYLAISYNFLRGWI